MCKNHDLHIINGRFGDDSISLIDYAIASPDLLTKVTNFSVDIFDPLLLDVHNRICLLLENRVVSNKMERKS